MYYARVIFETDASAAERHGDVSSARNFIDEACEARPESFRRGEIFERDPDFKIIATRGAEGWNPPT